MFGSSVAGPGRTVTTAGVGLNLVRGEEARPGGHSHHRKRRDGRQRIAIHICGHHLGCPADALDDGEAVAVEHRLVVVVGAVLASADLPTPENGRQTLSGGGDPICETQPSDQAGQTISPPISQTASPTCQHLCQPDAPTSERPGADVHNLQIPHDVRQRDSPWEHVDCGRACWRRCRFTCARVPPHWR